MSSEFASIEVVLATRQLDPSVLPEARMLLSQLDLIPLSPAVVEQAAEVGDPLLRSLDAIHLASALSIREELTSFVAYDGRLAAAARTAGLSVSQPGRQDRSR